MEGRQTATVIPEEIRVVQLCEFWHCPPSVVDEQPAALGDWTIAYHALREEVRADQERRANGG